VPISESCNHSHPAPCVPTLLITVEQPRPFDTSRSCPLLSSVLSPSIPGVPVPILRSIDLSPSIPHVPVPFFRSSDVSPSIRRIHVHFNCRATSATQFCLFVSLLRCQATSAAQSYLSMSLLRCWAFSATVSSCSPRYSVFISRLSFIFLIIYSLSSCSFSTVFHLAHLQRSFILLIFNGLSSCSFSTVSHLAHFQRSLILLIFNCLSSCSISSFFHLAHFLLSSSYPFPTLFHRAHSLLSFISPTFYSLSSCPFPTLFHLAHPLNVFHLAHDYCRETALDELASIAPSDLFEQLFIVALGAGFAVAQSAPQAAQEPLKSCLEKCAGYAVETCGRHMSPAKLERLCQVSRGWALSFQDLFGAWRSTIIVSSCSPEFAWKMGSF
jgi:hypothetical protein